MTETSEDRFWQLVNDEWIPTQKQLDAIDSGAIPHEKTLNEQSQEKVEDVVHFDSKTESEPLLSNNSKVNTCAACGNEFEGKNARTCPGRKCRNPICLECAPLETSFQKKVGKLGTVANIVTGDVAGLLGDKVEGELSRVRCKQCVKRDQRQDVMLLSAVFSFILAFVILALMKLFLPFNAFILYLFAYTISFFILMKLLDKIYSAILEYISPLLRKIPNNFKTGITIAIGSLGTIIFIISLINSGTDYSEHEIVGEWYSTVETLEFQSDGAVVHTTSTDFSIIEWRVDGDDLFLEWSDDLGYEYSYKYQISEEFLFVAPYAEADDGTVSEDECLVMSSDKDGENENYWNDVNVSSPEWCNI
jgi:hypothetical protein